MHIEFKGTLVVGDDTRTNSETPNGAILIDGQDVVDEIHERAWNTNVRALVNGSEVARGPVVSEIGWGYSSWTPMESDAFKVGDIDLIEILGAFDGQQVTLVVTDEE